MCEAQGVRWIDNWKFTSEFDGGNALASSWKRDARWEAGPSFSAEIARDCHGDPKTRKTKAYWFHFGVRPPKKYCGDVRFTLRGMCEQRDLSSTNYTFWMKTPRHPSWQRMPPGVSLRRSDVLGWECSWQHTFDGSPGHTYFAFCHPYSYGELMSWLDRLQADFGGAMATAEWRFLSRFGLLPTSGEGHDAELLTDSRTAPSKTLVSEVGPDIRFLGQGDENCVTRRGGRGIYFHRQTIALTPRNRAVELLTVTEAVDPGPPDELPDAVALALRQRGCEVSVPFRFPGRPVCFFSGRVHPGETPGQFATNGFLQFALSDKTPADSNPALLEPCTSVLCGRPLFLTSWCDFAMWTD